MIIRESRKQKAESGENPRVQGSGFRNCLVFEISISR
jgi:hypothetical protein